MQPGATLIVVGDEHAMNKQVNAEVQTEVHLEHCVRAITWAPVMDQDNPVHDMDDEFAEGILEGEQAFAEPVNKICNITDQNALGPQDLQHGDVVVRAPEVNGDVNDVDPVEIFREKPGAN